jgi:hypothetical protein
MNRCVGRRLGGLALVVIGLLASAGPASAQQLFSPTSYRNTPLPSNAPLDPLSAAYANDLTDKATRIGAHVSYSSYTTPVYTVPSDQPTQRVYVDNPEHEGCISGIPRYGNPCLEKQWLDVPLPPNPVPSGGTDGWLVVYQPATDTFWEFWQFHVSTVDGKPHATYGGRMTGVSANPGHFTDPSPGKNFGASGTSIPLLAGLQRIGELQSGAIEHVVSFAMNSPQQGHRWPAQRDDGTGSLPTVAMEGTCFRLPASLNLAQYNLTPYGLTVARAVQKYGMVMSDATTTGLVMFAEKANDGSDPYTGAAGIFHGLDDSGGGGGVLRNFPWNQLQALAAGTC